MWVKATTEIGQKRIIEVGRDKWQHYLSNCIINNMQTLPYDSLKFRSRPTHPRKPGLFAMQTSPGGSPTCGHDIADPKLLF